MGEAPRAWALYDGVDQTGPLDEAHVVRMIAAGLPEGTLGRCEGTSAWVNLRTHAPFAMAFERRGVVAPAPWGATTRAPAAQGEIVFAEEPGLKVTNVRAVFGANIYPLANITSVSRHVEPRPPLLLVVTIGLVALGALCVVAGSAPGSIVFLTFGVIAAALYFGGFREKHWVRIGTAGKEANALACANADHAQRVVDALNRAIVSRG